MKKNFIPIDIDEVVERVSSIAKDLSGKSVLLSGGRGFLGRYFMEVFNQLNKKVLDKPVTVIVLDNLITAGEEGALIPNKSK